MDFTTAKSDRWCNNTVCFYCEWIIKDCLEICTATEVLRKQLNFKSEVTRSKRSSCHIALCLPITSMSQLLFNLTETGACYERLTARLRWFFNFVITFEKTNLGIFPKSFWANQLLLLFFSNNVVTNHCRLSAYHFLRYSYIHKRFNVHGPYPVPMPNRQQNLRLLLKI